jgi:hypothetical protein
MFCLTEWKDPTNARDSRNEDDFSGALKRAAGASCRLQAFPETECEGSESREPETVWWQSSAPDRTMPTPAPQPLAPAQFEPQSGAISIANIVAMAIPLARARAILCVSFSMCDPNESTLRQGTTDVNAMCAAVMIQAQKRQPIPPGSTGEEWANRYLIEVFAAGLLARLILLDLQCYALPARVNRRQGSRAIWLGSGAVRILCVGRRLLGHMGREGSHRLFAAEKCHLNGRSAAVPLHGVFPGVYGFTLDDNAVVQSKCSLVGFSRDSRRRKQKRSTEEKC